MKTETKNNKGSCMYFYGNVKFVVQRKKKTRDTALN